MCKIGCRWSCALIVLAVGLTLLWTAPAPAQTTEPPETEAPGGDTGETGTPSTAHPPAYIGDLMTESGMTQTQVDQMRADGMGWGEIRIACRLAEQMAADSGGTLSFNDALSQVLASHAEGRGWGQIAADHNLKVGNLVKSDKSGKSDSASSTGKATSTAAKEKKPGLLARIGRALGFGRAADKSAKGEKTQAGSKDMKSHKPDRPDKMERGARPERMERPMMDKPTTVDKPSKPDVPGMHGGPSR